MNRGNGLSRVVGGDMSSLVGATFANASKCSKPSARSQRHAKLSRGAFHTMTLTSRSQVALRSASVAPGRESVRIVLAAWPVSGS